MKNAQNRANQSKSGDMISVHTKPAEINFHSHFLLLQNGEFSVLSTELDS